MFLLCWVNYYSVMNPKYSNADKITLKIVFAIAIMSSYSDSQVPKVFALTKILEISKEIIWIIKINRKFRWVIAAWCRRCCNFDCSTSCHFAAASFRQPTNDTIDAMFFISIEFNQFCSCVVSFLLPFLFLADEETLAKFIPQ